MSLARLRLLAACHAPAAQQHLWAVQSQWLGGISAAARSAAPDLACCEAPRWVSSSSTSSCSTPPDLAGADRIVLRGLVFHGHHGALPEENVLGQKFVVDAVLWTDLAAAGASDVLAATVDYAAAYREIQAVVQGPARALQEAVAEETAQRLLALDARVSAVSVYLRKPHVALPGVLESVGVEVLRRRRSG